MSIRQMLPIGTHLRKCPVCGYPITAKSDELTMHELICWSIEPKPAPDPPPCGLCDGTGWLEPIGPKDDGSYITSRPCPRCQR
jgi:hypothetical protein